MIIHGIALKGRETSHIQHFPSKTKTKATRTVCHIYFLSNLLISVFLFSPGYLNSLLRRFSLKTTLVCYEERKFFKLTLQYTEELNYIEKLHETFFHVSKYRYSFKLETHLCPWIYWSTSSGTKVYKKTNFCLPKINLWHRLKLTFYGSPILTFEYFTVKNSHLQAINSLHSTLEAYTQINWKRSLRYSYLISGV